MYKVVDLFSGAGGLTFGFEYGVYNNRFTLKDDFESLFAIDFNKKATEAFSYNFPHIPILHEDIKLMDEQRLLNLIGKNKIDVVVGGPPCQSFSLIGKRVNDDRSKLYKEYIRVLKVLKPKIFIFENVKGILTMKDEDSKTLVLDRIIKDFRECGYKTTYKVLNSADFGVPQLRERVFIVGVRDDINHEYTFPQSSFSSDNYLTLSDAISDLPILGNGESSDVYTSLPLTKYQELMRFGSDGLMNHSNGQKSELIMEIIESLEEGESKKDINRKVSEGTLPKYLWRSSGYDNTYGRLWADKPGMTITNKINCPSSLRCIHPYQNRALTSREGARVQSFPDWFIFCGGVGDVMSQIGNAVPPLLSISVANSIFEFLRKEEARK